MMQNDKSSFTGSMIENEKKYQINETEKNNGKIKPKNMNMV